MLLRCGVLLSAPDQWFVRLLCSRALTDLIRHPSTHHCHSGETRFSISAIHATRPLSLLWYSLTSLQHLAPCLRIFQNCRAVGTLALSRARRIETLTTLQPRLQRNMCSQRGMMPQYEVSSPRSRPRRRVRPNSEQEMVRHHRYSLDSQQAANRF
jgi:hypothetical protein